MPSPFVAIPTPLTPPISPSPTADRSAGWLSISRCLPLVINLVLGNVGIGDLLPGKAKAHESECNEDKKGASETKFLGGVIKVFLDRLQRLAFHVRFH